MSQSGFKKKNTTATERASHAGQAKTKASHSQKPGLRVADASSAPSRSPAKADSLCGPSQQKVEQKIERFQKIATNLRQALSDWQELSTRPCSLSPDELRLQEMRGLLKALEDQMRKFAL